MKPQKYKSLSRTFFFFFSRNKRDFILLWVADTKCCRTESTKHRWFKFRKKRIDRQEITLLSSDHPNFAKHCLATHTEMLWKLKINLTRGSLSPPTTCLTAPSIRERLRMVLLSLSAMKRQPQGSSGAEARPDGWARPALWGYALFLFSSFPLPAKRTHSPFLCPLQSHNEDNKRLVMCKSLHTPRIKQWQRNQIHTNKSLLMFSLSDVNAYILYSYYRDITLHFPLSLPVRR